MAESDQCAFNLNGTLKDMLEIDFIHGPDDPPLNNASNSLVQPSMI